MPWGNDPAPTAPAAQAGGFGNDPQVAGVTAGGIGKAFGSGLARTALQQVAGGAHGDLRDVGRTDVDGVLQLLTQNGIINADQAHAVHGALRDAFHALDPVEHGYDSVNALTDVMAPAMGMAAPPHMTAPNTDTMAHAAGVAYTPQNEPERYAQVAGQMLPNATIPVGEAGAGAQILQRGLNVIAPTVGAEGSRQLAEAAGADPATQGLASTVGGLAGGVVAGGAPAAAAKVSETLGGRVDMNAANAQAGAELARLGLSPADVPQEVGTDIGAMLSKGVAPVDAVHAALAKSQPVPVPLSRGQMSGQPGQQMYENATLRGANGVPAATFARGFQQTQQSAIRQGATQIGADIAGGNPVPTSTGGQAVSTDLNAQFDAAKGQVNAAYDNARDVGVGAHLPAAQLPVLGAQLRDAVKAYDPQTVPAVTRELDKVDTLSTPTAQDLFDLRARLSNLRGINDGVTAGAAGKAIDALDAHISDAVSNDLFTGDPAAVKSWRDAIGARRQFGKVFQGDNLVQALTERGPDGSTLKVAPEDATNYIFGRSALGFVGKRGLTRDLASLRDTLGADSGSWNALRSEAWNRIAGSAEGPMEAGAPQFSGAKLASAWNRAKSQDPNVLDVLFSPQEQGVINRFVATTQRATTPVRGGDNPSNTAITLKSFFTLPFIRNAAALTHAIPFVDDMVGKAHDMMKVGRIKQATVYAKPGGTDAPKLPRPAVNLPNAFAPAATVAPPPPQLSQQAY